MKSDIMYGPIFPGAIGFTGYEEFITSIVLDTNILSNISKLLLN
jgi:hypothetical protein